MGQNRQHPIPKGPPTATAVAHLLPAISISANGHSGSGRTLSVEKQIRMGKQTWDGGIGKIEFEDC